MNKDAIHDLQMLVWNSSNTFADMRLFIIRSRLVPVRLHWGGREMNNEE